MDGLRSHVRTEKNMLLSLNLTMRGSDVTSLVEFRPVVKEVIADGLMDGRRSHGWTEKIYCSGTTLP